MHQSGRAPLLLAVIAAVALVVRLFYLIVVRDVSAPPQFDGITYDLIARSLLAGHGFGTDAPTAFRTPGYPVFVAVIYAIGGHSVAVLRIVQAVLGAATTVVTYHVSMLVFSRRRLSLLAAALVAVHPILIYLTWMVYAETLATLLVMLTLLLLLRTTTQNRWSMGAMVVLGSVAGALVLLRPPLVLFVALSAGWLWIVGHHRRGSMTHIAAFVLMTFLFILPWTIRNYVRFGELIPLATSGGVTFWSGNHPLARGGAVNPSRDTWLGSDPPPRDLSGWPGLTEKESERRFYKAAVDWIRQNPVQALNLLPQKLVRSWVLAFGNVARPASTPEWITVGYGLYPLSVVAGLLLSFADRRNLAPIYCLLLGQTLVSLGFYGSSRQSAVIIPGMLILSAFALEKLLSSTLVILPRKEAAARAD